MIDKLKIYGVGIFTGFWIHFIILNLIIQSGNLDFIENGIVYPKYKMLIGIGICLFFTFLVLFRKENPYYRLSEKLPMVISKPKDP